MKDGRGAGQVSKWDSGICGIAGKFDWRYG